MNKILTSQRGITVLELLGAIAIMAIISAIAFPILIGGMKTSASIQKETMLRNEADYVMASFMKEIYTMKESDITEKELPKAGTTNYFLKKSNGKKTGFINNEIVIADTKIKLLDPNIALDPSTIKKYKDTDGQYEITLRLRITGDRPMEMKFVNVVRTINDVRKEEVNP